MENFPTIAKPSYPIDCETEDPVIAAGFENGSEQTRARFTRMRRRFALRWPALTNAQRETLNAFYVARKGGSEAFIWTDPYDSTAYTVRFDGTIKEIQINPEMWNVEITLREM